MASRTWLLLLTRSSTVKSRTPTLSINGSQSNPPFNVMHYHLDTAHSQSLSLNKRNRPRAMTRCPNSDARGFVFLRSNCIRNGNLRDLMMYCGDGHYVHVIPQSCNHNELCVDTGNPARSGDAKAYCVSANNFFRIPSSVQQQVTGDFELYIPSNSKPFAAEALLVDWARIHGLRRTENFVLSAVWEIVPVSAGFAPRRVVLDSVHCVGCYSLKLQPLSEDTNFLTATVDLRAAPAGYLYLITIS